MTYIMNTPEIGAAENTLIEARRVLDEFETAVFAMAPEQREAIQGELNHLRGVAGAALINYFRTVEAAAICKYLPHVGLGPELLQMVRDQRQNADRAA